ncbi:MAG: hypothetical protein K1X64_08660 [Myxococcaceae bacterium]|nr:hypothetical protein [Myxococcaceae bacterium]
MKSLEVLYSVLAGAAIVAVFSILGRQAFEDLQRFGDTPLPVDIIGAVRESDAGRQWVSVHDAPWNCGESVRVGHTFFPAHIDGFDVVARYDHDVTCSEVVRQPLEGIIEVVEQEDFERFKQQGLTSKEIGNVRLLSVCVDCGKDNARLGVIICGAFILLGLGIYPLRRALLAAYRGWTSSINDALRSPPSESASAEKKLRIRGAVTLLVGILAYAFGRDYVVWRAVPLHWIGIVGITFGLVYVLFPQKLRRLMAHAESRRQGK